MQSWARDNRDGIRRCATLLDIIIETARSNPSRLLEVHCPGSHCLEIRKQFGNGVHALPADVVAWWQEIGRGADSVDENATGGRDGSDGGVGFDGEVPL